MPMGLAWAPIDFQEWGEATFGPHQSFILVYIDDLLVFSKTMAKHVQHLKHFAQICAETSIVLSTKKIVLATHKVKFLGIVICQGQITMQPHVLTKLQEFANVLSTPHDVHSFLGCTHWLVQHYPWLSTDTQPIRKALHKGVISWTLEATHAVQTIKDVIRRLPALKLPEDGTTLIVYSDASNSAWGGVLTELEQDSEDENICRFASGSFSSTKINYLSIHREILAAKRTFKAFKLFIIGRVFIHRTDLCNMRSFMSSTNIEEMGNSRLLRWSLWFDNWDFTQEYIPSKKNLLADMLSRIKPPAILEKES